MRKMSLTIALLFIAIIAVTSCSSGGSSKSEKKNSDVTTDKENLPDSDQAATPDGGKDDVKEDKDTRADEDISVDAGITVKNSDVRACDILLEMDGSVLDSAIFKGSVKGEYGKRGNKFAISFLNREDKAFTEIGELVFSKNSGSVKITKTSCYDKAGKAVDNPEVSIEGVEFIK